MKRKRYIFLSSCVACLSLLMAMGNDQALTAKNSATPSSNQPLKVLGIKLDTANTSTAKASWLDSLEVQVENTSGKTIKYLVIHVELPGVASDETPLRIPFWYGQPPVPNTKSGEFAIFQPGRKLTLKASKNVCDSMRKQLLASGRVPASSKEIQANINLVIFEDKTSWMDGQLHYPDPANPMKWISTEELTRKNSVDSRTFVMSKASYKSASKSQTCYRDTGFELIPCCGGLFAGSKILQEDPNGHVHPNLVESCCSPGDCCSYVEVAGGCE